MGAQELGRRREVVDMEMHYLDLSSRKDLLPNCKECHQREPPAIRFLSFCLSYRGHSSPEVIPFCGQPTFDD